jgi:pyruvate/2-oxoacid:ferredoxin oxidoreductase beta subunit
MSLERIKKGLAFTRANKKFSNLDKMYFQLNKMKRRGIDVSQEELDKLSMDLGNAAFDLNQADMAIGGDGDYASYDDVGGPGFDQVVQRQETLNKILKKYN